MQMFGAVSSARQVPVLEWLQLHNNYSRTGACCKIKADHKIWVVLLEMPSSFSCRKINGGCLEFFFIFFFFDSPVSGKELLEGQDHFN